MVGSGGCLLAAVLRPFFFLLRPALKLASKINGCELVAVDVAGAGSRLKPVHLKLLN